MVALRYLKRRRAGPGATFHAQFDEDASALVRADADAVADLPAGGKQRKAPVPDLLTAPTGATGRTPGRRQAGRPAGRPPQHHVPHGKHPPGRTAGRRGRYPDRRRRPAMRAGERARREGNCLPAPAAGHRITAPWGGVGNVGSWKPPIRAVSNFQRFQGAGAPNVGSWKFPTLGRGPTPTPPAPPRAGPDAHALPTF